MKQSKEIMGNIARKEDFGVSFCVSLVRYYVSFISGMETEH